MFRLRVTMFVTFPARVPETDITMKTKVKTIRIKINSDYIVLLFCVKLNTSHYLITCMRVVFSDVKFDKKFRSKPFLRVYESWVYKFKYTKHT